MPLEPRISCADFNALRQWGIAGLGVALLPDRACARELKSSELARLFPAWGGQEGIVHIVFTTRTDCRSRFASG